jgi:membrane associated rhomboid family serine protease
VAPVLNTRVAVLCDLFRIISLGASGALFGVLAYYSASYPDSQLLLMFVIQVSARDAMLGATVVNGLLMLSHWNAARRGTRGIMIDGASHLVGTIVGYAWFLWAQSQWRPRTAAPRYVQRFRDDEDDD